MANLEIDASQTAPREEPSLDFSFSIRGPALRRVEPRTWVLLFLLLVGLVLRLGLGAIQGTAFTIDTGTFEAWSLRLADKGPWNFYSKDYFSDYAPGYLYVLFLIGKLNTVFEFNKHEFQFIFKLPSIIADVGIAYLLYLFLEGRRGYLRLGAVAVYIFFPPAILMGAIWGQVDSLSVFFLMLSVYWISRDKPVEGAVAYVVGFIIKPQIIAALPFLAFWIIRRNPPDPSRRGEGVIPDVWIKTTVAGFGALLVLILPFFPDNPWGFITQLKDAADVENYRVTSFWAYNFWGMVHDFFKADNVDSCIANPSCTGAEFLGIEYRYWGIFLFAVAIIVIIYVLRDARGDWVLPLGTALCLLAFYMFLTRMHERYMFPALVPFLAACVLARSPILWGTFVVLAVVQFLNLYQVYGYYETETNALRIEALYDYFERPRVLSAWILPDWNLQRWLSFVTFLTFPISVIATYLLANPLRRSEAA
jgi:Gpi18-like mannosyltransferase